MLHKEVKKEMAWETRVNSKSRYYYRAKRVNGRIHKICCGSGGRGEALAKQDSMARAERAADVTAARQLKAELEPLIQLAADADKQVELLVASALLAAGCHKHRGQWRKKRHGIDEI